MQSLRYDKKPEKTEKSDAGWMNIGGARAYVDTDGEIEHACPGLEGENITDIINESDASRDRREEKQEAAEAAGWEPERIKDAREVYEDAKQEAPEGHFVVYRKGENYYVFGDEASVLRDLTNTGDGDFAEFKEDAKDYQFERILNGGHKIAIFEEEGQGEEEAELVGTEEPAQEPIPEDAGKPQKEMPKPPGLLRGMFEKLANTRDARKTGSVSTDQLNDSYAKRVYEHMQDIERSGDGFGDVYDLSDETGHDGALGYHSPAGVLVMLPPHFKNDSWEVRFATEQSRGDVEKPAEEPEAHPDARMPGESMKDYLGRRKEGWEEKFRNTPAEDLIAERESLHDATKSENVTQAQMAQNRITKINNELRRRGHREPDEQDKSYMAFAQNASDVAADPENADSGDLRRAVGFHVGYQRHWERQAARGEISQEEANQRITNAQSEIEWYNEILRKREAEQLPNDVEQPTEQLSADLPQDSPQSEIPAEQDTSPGQGEDIQSMIDSARQFAEYGENYDRNIASTLGRIDSALRRGFSPDSGAMGMLYEELSTRLKAKEERKQEASIDLGTKSDDMASVNVPMSQRGDIDAQLDAHKKREERAARAKQKANAQTRRKNKAKAKSLFSDHGDGFIQSVIERKPGTDPREAKKTLDSLVKWEPEKAIEMLEGWASEQEQKEAPALQQDISQDDDKEEEIPDWLADAGEEEAKEEISSSEKSYESMSREELLAENNRRLPGMEKLNEMESDEELREHLRKDDLHQEQHQRDIDEEDSNMSKESNLKKFRKKHMERFDRQARVFRMEDGPREAIQAKMDQYTSGKHPDGKRMKQWEADNLRREIYNDILEAKGLDRNARMKIQDPPEGSKSKKISPTSKLGRAITDAVGNDPEDREGFADLLHEIYGMKREHIQNYNDALDELIGNFAGDLTGRKRLIGQLQQARDPAHIAAFDEMVEMAENSYPILIQGVGDSEAGLNDPEYALFEAIKSGRKSVPAIHSDEIVGEALSYLDTFDRSGQASQDDPGEDWDHGFYRRRGQKLRNFRGSYHKWMRSKYSRWVKFSSRKQNSQL